MPRLLRVVWLLLGLGSLVFVVVLFFLPANWEVTRSAVIAAPPEAVWPWIEDLDRWRRWSPWKESDYEGLTFAYSERTSGPGAEVTWDSERTGDGRLRIEAADPPRRLELAMAFQEGKITTRDTLDLEPVAGGTRVTWRDAGTLGNTLLGRLSLPVIEESMGRDLARGLEQLAAAVAEGEAAPAPATATTAVAPIPEP